MKNEYFNEREKRLFNSFSNKDDFYKGCFFGETNPIIDNKINKIEEGSSKVIRSNLRKQRIKIKGNNYLSLLTFMNQR